MSEENARRFLTRQTLSSVNGTVHFELGTLTAPLYAS
jgi:hypothetical protein